jgi:hypothetical protein
VVDMTPKDPKAIDEMTALVKTIFSITE